MKNIREGQGTLLDNCMIVYGSGTIRTGRHVRYARNTPLNNLWLSMLDRIGSSVDSLGDSTGRLANLT